MDGEMGYKDGTVEISEAEYAEILGLEEGQTGETDKEEAVEEQEDLEDTGIDRLMVVRLRRGESRKCDPDFRPAEDMADDFVQSVITGGTEASDTETEGADQMHQEEALRRFHYGVKVLPPASGAGDASIRFIQGAVEAADGNFCGGVQKLRRIASPAAAAMAIAGARELSRAAREELKQIAEAGSAVQDMIKRGEISAADLEDRESLKRCLKQGPGKHAAVRGRIIRYRRTLYDLLAVQCELEKRSEKDLLFEKELKWHLQSPDYFDLSQQKTNGLLKTYFQTGGNDMLKNVHPASMRAEDLTRLMRTGDKNGLTETDMAALRLSRRQMCYREARIRARNAPHFKKLLEHAGMDAFQKDDAADAGLRNLVYASNAVQAAISVGTAGVKAGIVTASFVGKYTGAASLLAKAGGALQEKGTQAAQGIKRSIRENRAYQEIRERAAECLNTNAGVQRYRNVQRKAAGRAKQAVQKGQRTKAAAKAAHRKTEKISNIVFAPLHLAEKTVGVAGMGVSRLRLLLLGTVGIVVVVFLILVVSLNVILSVCRTQSDAAFAVIFTDQEPAVGEAVRMLQSKAEMRKEEAEQTAEGGGVTYVDGNGNPLLYGTNNIKDCIVLAYILMDGEFDMDAGARDSLILDLWDFMNPEITCRQDTYTCPGCVEEEGELVCSGHEKIEVRVPTYSMEEVWDKGLASSGRAPYQAYLEAFCGWDEDNREWAENLYNGDWYDLYGIDPSVGASVPAGDREEIGGLLDAYGDLDEVRIAICEDAVSFVGRIPYYWGGKAGEKDYEANHFNTAVPPDYKGRNKKGLDCSGFVQWVIWRVTDKKVGGSTATITAGMEKISAAELRPGDLGLMAVPGTASNHVGIFIGYNEKGQALWCHENSSAGNVAVNTATCFRYYYSIF